MQHPHLFFRTPTSGFHSMESVFHAVTSNFPADIQPTTIYLPTKSASPAGLFKNSLFAFRNRGKVNHVTGDVHYIVPALGRDTILTIHDIGAAFNGRFLHDLYIKLFWLWLPAMFVKYITVISHTSANEVLQYIAFAKRKIRVIHNPVDERFRFTPKATLADIPKILHLGTKPNKNLERTIAALQGINCELWLVGRLNPEQTLALHQNNIRYKNFLDLPYEEIIHLYQACDIVSFPTLYEGFGMPMIEAQATGRPVLAGDIAVLHEVGGEGALFVNPHSLAAIRDGFNQLLTNTTLRDNLVTTGRENVKRFDAKIIAEQYAALYRSLGG